MPKRARLRSAGKDLHALFYACTHDGHLSMAYAKNKRGVDQYI